MVRLSAALVLARRPVQLVGVQRRNPRGARATRKWVSLMLADGAVDEVDWPLWHLYRRVQMEGLYVEGLWHADGHAGSPLWCQFAPLTVVA